WVVRGAETTRSAEALRDYCARPSPTTCLLLLADGSLAADRDRKDHWLLAAVPAAAIVFAPVRKGRQLQDWLRQRAADEGYTVSPDAARLLVDFMGEDPLTLLSEVRKAALAGGPDNVAVGAKEVGAVVGEHRVQDVFDLTRAVERRDAATALATLDRLLAGEEPMRILSLMSRQVRQLWSAREYLDDGQTPAQIARMLRVPPPAADAIVGRARGVTRAQLSRQLTRCWEVERRLKSSGEPRAEVTALVAELCAG
ncbi:MAG TPA: DNA polymerase III subunit delta, partial [Terriglobales bacterium]|nr:DNA polymerase III subunit delta [Terriglobales bacterium]